MPTSTALSDRCTASASSIPFYPREHATPPAAAALVGATPASICPWALVGTHQAGFGVAALAFGDGLAWSGHVAFEKQRPASFEKPPRSLPGDWRM